MPAQSPVPPAPACPPPVDDVAHATPPWPPLDDAAPPAPPWLLLPVVDAAPAAPHWLPIAPPCSASPPQLGPIEAASVIRRNEAAEAEKRFTGGVYPIGGTLAR